MSLVRMDIQTIVSSNGPIASLIVLRPHDAGTTTVQLPIRIGNIEAAAISMGVGKSSNTRPMTHDTFAATIRKLGATLSGVAIVSAQGTTFFAQLMLVTSDGANIVIDSRPSDAIALAIRMSAPIYADESVLTAAALPDFKAVETSANAAELERFHDFLENLTPADFE